MIQMRWVPAESLPELASPQPPPSLPIHCSNAANRSGRLGPRRRKPSARASSQDDEGVTEKDAGSGNPVGGLRLSKHSSERQAAFQHRNV